MVTIVPSGCTAYDNSVVAVTGPSGPSWSRATVTSFPVLAGSYPRRSGCRPGGVIDRSRLRSAVVTTP